MSRLQQNNKKITNSNSDCTYSIGDMYKCGQCR